MLGRNGRLWIWFRARTTADQCKWTPWDRCRKIETGKTKRVKSACVTRPTRPRCIYSARCNKMKWALRFNGRATPRTHLKNTNKSHTFVEQLREAVNCYDVWAISWNRSCAPIPARRQWYSNISIFFIDCDDAKFSVNVACTMKIASRRCSAVIARVGACTAMPWFYSK